MSPMNGTTLGILVFSGGVVAFFDSRRTGTVITPEGVEKRIYLDVSEKFEIISSESNLLYTRCGDLLGNEELVELLRYQVHIAENENGLDGVLGVARAGRIARRILDNLVQEPNLKDRTIGGFLIGRGLNEEYKVHLILAAKGINPLNVVCPPRPFHSVGSGAKLCRNAMKEFDSDPQDTPEQCIVKIKKAMLNTYLHSNGSGGPIRVFVIRDGENIGMDPNFTFDPVDVHIDVDTFDVDQQIILVIVARRDVGFYDDIDQAICAWDTVICVSRITHMRVGGDQEYSAYWVVGDSPASMRTTLHRLQAVPAVLAEEGNHMPIGMFGYFSVPVGEAMVNMHVGECSEARLRFIQENKFVIPAEEWEML